MRKRILLITALAMLMTVPASAQMPSLAATTIQNHRKAQLDSLRRVLGLSSALRLEWMTSTNGVDTFRVIDDFNREEIGSDWACDGRFWAIVDSEMSTTPAADNEWRYLAVFRPVYNDAERRIYSVSYRWGRNVDALGVREGAMALMIDMPSSEGSGYWLWHRYDGVWLWIIKDGAWEYTPGEGKEVDRQPGLPDPVAGDVVTGVVRDEPSAVYFDYYINDEFDATVKDYTKEFPKNYIWYVGLFLHGQELNNQVDDFTVTWLKGDGVAPAPVTDLHAVDSTASTITLEWTSTGDNGYDGQADHFELRYSTLPIDNNNFSSATLVPNLPPPASSGQVQQFTVDGLNDYTTYYFAIKIFDEVNNASGLSNVAQVRTRTDGIARTLAIVTGCDQTDTVATTLPVPLTAKVTDKHSLPVIGHPVQFVVVSGGGNLQGDSTKTVLTDSIGQAAVKLTLGQVAGDSNNVVEIRASGLTGSPIRCAASALPGAPKQLIAVSSTNQLVPVDTVAAPLVARVADSLGNSVPKQSVVYNIISGGGYFLNGKNPVGKVYQTLSDSAGLAKAVLRASMIWGDTTKIGVKIGDTLSAPAQVPKFFIVAAPPDSIAAIKGNNQTAPIGTALAESLVVKIFDLTGTVAKNYPVTFRILSGGGFLANHQPQVEVNTDTSGLARTQWTLGTVAGIQQVEASAKFKEKNLRNAPFLFTATAVASSVSATRSTLAVSPQRGIAADSMSAAVVTVTLRDEFDNPVSGKMVRLSVTGSNNFITQPAHPTDSTGRAIAWLRSTRAEWKTVSAHVIGDSLTLTQTVRVQFIAMAAAQIRLHSGDQQTGVINRQLPQPVVVQTVDKFGNPTSQTNVVFIVLMGGGRIIGNSIVATDTNGLAKAVWQLGPAPGINKLEARAEGLAGSPVVFTATGKDTTTAVNGEHAAVPRQFALYQNSPNPFNPETTIHFDLPEAAQVEMRLYDLTGRQVRQLLQAQMPAGAHRLLWDGRDDSGRPVDSGVYFVMLRAVSTLSNKELVATRKIILMK